MQTTLELGNPRLEPLIRLDQPLIRLDQLAEPKQQPQSRLPITIKNRLGLAPLHTQTFAARPQVPAPPRFAGLSRPR